MNPKYPIYIISKGRWDTRLTSRSLERLGVPYSIVIEPQEFDQYAKVIDPAKIICLPFSNLGQGSIPARNFVWDHATETGAARHWIMDDNIEGFFRLNNNIKQPVGDGTIIRCCEEFTDRYENVPMSGMNYFMFASRKSKVPPFYLNTRVYSCILLSNSVDYRWRGRYNEDTDLSLRILKDGWCTILFNTFLCGKTTTMSMKGGNTDELYIQNEEMDGRKVMAQSLVDQHPDVATLSFKWGRYQHHVDYRRFRKFNKLKRASSYSYTGDTDNFGMELKSISDEQRALWLQQKLNLSTL